MPKEHTDYVAETVEAITLLRGDKVVEFGLTTQEVVETEDGRFVFTKGGAWIKLHTSFRNRLLRKLKGSRLSVFLCIGLHIDDKNECYPTIATIAEETGLSEREVKYTIQELESDGLIGVFREHRKANVYVVNRMVAYGDGNTPLGEFSAPKTECASECTQTMRQNAPQEEPYKKNQSISTANSAVDKPDSSSAEEEHGETECGMPEGLNEAKSKALRFGCTFCAEKDVIGWKDRTCPNCGAVIKWTGNKWLDRIIKREGLDKLAAAKKGKLQAELQSNPALAHFLTQFPDYYVTPEDRKEINAFIERVNLASFKKHVAALILSDADKSMSGPGIAKHVIRSLRYWGEFKKAKAGRTSIESTDSTPVAPGTTTATSKLPTALPWNSPYDNHA